MYTSISCTMCVAYISAKAVVVCSRVPICVYVCSRAISMMSICYVCGVAVYLVSSRSVELTVYVCGGRHVYMLCNRYAYAHHAHHAH